MLKSLEIVDFQSHHNTKLELDRFTAIVGSSSVGKTAVARALLLLAENGRGTAYVRKGASRTRVTGTVWQSDSISTVSVERGKNLSQYELRLDSADPKIYTKCGTSTPDDVQSVLKLGSDRIWLANQFDRPYLLDESGGKIARVLGELTGVSVLFGAVRELNRRSIDVQRRAKDVDIDLASVREQIQRHADLPARRAACSTAETALQRARDLIQQRARLSTFIDALTQACTRREAAEQDSCAVPDLTAAQTALALSQRLSTALSTLRRARARGATVITTRPPSIERLGRLTAVYQRVATGVGEASRTAQNRSRLSENADRTVLMTQELTVQMQVLLRQAGICPLCGAVTSH
jgi:hypothetical protein